MTRVPEGWASSNGVIMSPTCRFLGPVPGQFKGKSPFMEINKDNNEILMGYQWNISGILVECWGSNGEL